MPSIKVSELPSVSSLGVSGKPDLDIMMLIQQGISKKMTLASFLSNLNYPVVINANRNQTTGFRVHGNNVDNILLVDPNNNNVGIGPAPLTGTFPNAAVKLDVNGNIRVHGNYVEASEYIIPPLDGGIKVPADYTNTDTNKPQIAQAGVISSLIAITNVAVYGDSKYNLSAGTHGQEKTIVIVSEEGGSIQAPAKASIDVDLVGDKINIVLKGVGTSVSLKYIFIDNSLNGWVVVGQYGNVTVS